MMNVQQLEDAEYEMNAQYDYVQEAYGDLGDSPEMLRQEMEYIAQFEDYGPHLPRVDDGFDDCPF